MCGMFICIEGSAHKVMKKINDKTFVIDYSNKIIYNKSNSAFDVKQYEAYDPQRFEVVNWQIVKEAFKASIANERLQKMKKESVGLVTNCDYEGNIETVKFIFPKEIFMTVEEIEKIESNLKSRKFLISCYTEKEQDGIQIGIPCRLASVLR